MGLSGYNPPVSQGASVSALLRALRKNKPGYWVKSNDQEKALEEVISELRKSIV